MATDPNNFNFQQAEQDNADFEPNDFFANSDDEQQFPQNDSDELGFGINPNFDIDMLSGGFPGNNSDNDNNMQNNAPNLVNGNQASEMDTDDSDEENEPEEEQGDQEEQEEQEEENDEEQPEEQGEPEQQDGPEVDAEHEGDEGNELEEEPGEQQENPAQPEEQGEPEQQNEPEVDANNDDDGEDEPEQQMAVAPVANHDNDDEDEEESDSENDEDHVEQLEERMFQAIAENNLAQVIDCIENESVNINAFSNGYHALSLAIKLGFYDIVEYFINHNASLDSESTEDNYTNLTPFHIAVKYNQLDIMRLLAKSGVNVNSVCIKNVICEEDDKSNTETKEIECLAINLTSNEKTLAFLNKIDELIDLIDKPYAIKNEKSKQQETRFGLGLLGDDDVEMELETKKMTESQLREKMSVLTNALGRAITFCVEGETLLHKAAKVGNVPAFNILLELGCQMHCLNRSGETPLFVACSNGQETMVHHLLDKLNTPYSLTEIGKINNTLLHAAAESDNVSLLKYLVESKKMSPITLNRDGNTPLMYAVLTGKLKSVKYFESLGCSLVERNENGVNQLKSKYGETTFLLAALSDSVAMAEYILKKHEDVLNDADNNGQTALMLATKRNNPDMVKFLIANGANIMAKKKPRERILDIAISLKSNKVIPIIQAAFNLFEKAAGKKEMKDVLLNDLLLSGANISQCGKNKLTPLHYAAEIDNTEMVIELLNANADPFAKAFHADEWMDVAQFAKYERKFTSMILCLYSQAHQSKGVVEPNHFIDLVLANVPHKDFSNEVYYHLGCFSKKMGWNDRALDILLKVEPHSSFFPNAQEEVTELRLLTLDRTDNQQIKELLISALQAGTSVNARQLRLHVLKMFFGCSMDKASPFGDLTEAGNVADLAESFIERKKAMEERDSKYQLEVNNLKNDKSNLQQQVNAQGLEIERLNAMLANANANVPKNAASSCSSSSSSSSSASPLILSPGRTSLSSSKSSPDKSNKRKREEGSSSNAASEHPLQPINSGNKENEDAGSSTSKPKRART